MASLSTCHLGLWLGWQILLNLVKSSVVVSVIDYQSKVSEIKVVIGKGCT